MNTKNKILSESELEEFKKNYKNKIADVAKSKTEWLKPLQETYQENREAKSKQYNFKQKLK